MTAPNINISYVDQNGRPTIEFMKLLQDQQARIEALEGGGGDMKIAQAEREILGTYGQKVSVAEKRKSLLKFGKNESVGTSYQTVWANGGNESYVTTDAIDTVSSSNAGDAVTMKIEGHTVSGTGADAQYTFVIQTVVLNGQTKVVLGTPLARVSRAYIDSSTPLAGDFYVYEDTAISGGVPSDSTKVHLKIDGSLGETQSFKCATTVSNTDYGIITGGYASISKKTSASVDFVIEKRQPGGVFRPAGGRVTLNSVGLSAMEIKFDPYLILPKNSDIRVRAISTAANTAVDASIQMYLAIVI